MRRTIALATLTVCLAAGSAAAGANGRTVKQAYQPVEADPTVPQGGIHSSSSGTFRTRARERFVTVTIQDDSGLTVPGELRQDVDGDDEADFSQAFCGSTPDRVAIEPGVPVEVVRLTGSCNDLTDPTGYGGWTAGTVTVVFSR
jgi:hypothetical protein